MGAAVAEAKHNNIEAQCAAKVFDFFLLRKRRTEVRLNCKPTCDLGFADSLPGATLQVK